MTDARTIVLTLLVALAAATIPAAAAPSCLGAEPTISGSDGPDLIEGTPEPDVITAGDGDDIIFGGASDDIICAGSGEDTVTAGPGADSVDGGPGSDALGGGDGPDTLAGGAGDDHLEGEGGPDLLAGGAGGDGLFGGDRPDSLRGGAGDDILDGGGGPDELAGGEGADRLEGVLLADAVTDAGTRDAADDTWWYPSLVLEPLEGTVVVFSNTVSGLDQRHTHAVTVTHPDGGLLLVERLSPEEYLLGLGEMPYSWEAAALQAQAVAARTYLAQVLASPPRGVMAEFDFDICGSAVCQLYLGAGRIPTADGGDRWAQAVAATDGRILIYDGAPALAVYHSTAGATTRSVQDVWLGSEALPYLQAVPVPAQDSPFAAWTYDLGLDQFLAVLAAADISFPGEVTEVATTVTEPGGGPYQMVFQTTEGTVEVTADRIQRALNTYGPALYGDLLPATRPDGARYPQAVLSPTFTVHTLGVGATVRVAGQGWGHQLGMPQYGAQALALQGATAAAILAHFYSGLLPQADPGFLPGEISVGLGWDRAEVTLRAEHYALRSPTGLVAVGWDGTFRFRAGEGGMVALASP